MSSLSLLFFSLPSQSRNKGGFGSHAVKSRINDSVKTVAKVVLIIKGEIDLSLKTVVLFFFVFFFQKVDDFHGILMTDDCTRLEYAYGLSRSFFQIGWSKDF